MINFQNNSPATQTESETPKKSGWKLPAMAASVAARLFDLRRYSRNSRRRRRFLQVNRGVAMHLPTSLNEYYILIITRITYTLCFENIIFSSMQQSVILQHLIKKYINDRRLHLFFFIYYTAYMYAVYHNNCIQK